MLWELFQCDARKIPLPDGSARTCITSPPFWGLRDYGAEGQIGLEATPAEYVSVIVDVFREVRRVLMDDGTLWLNLGDTYCSAPNGNIGVASTLTGSLEGQEQYRKARASRGGHEGKHKYAGVATTAGPNRGPTSGLKPKALVGIPWRVALALQADGWYLRSDIIWSKPNCMPESVTDRPTCSHEYIFLLTKSERYYYDHRAIRERCQSGPSDIKKMKQGLKRFGGKTLDNADRLNAATVRTKVGRDRAVGDGEWRNRRTVWTVAPHGFKGAHFATYPQKLIEPCVLAGSALGDLVLDPFNGAATTGMVAIKHGRRYVGCDVNPAYLEMSRQRLWGVAPLFTGGAA